MQAQHVILGSTRTGPDLGRRALLGGATASMVPRAGRAAAQVRIGILQFGSVQWLADNSLIDDASADSFFSGHPDPALP